MKAISRKGISVVLVILLGILTITPVHQANAGDKPDRRVKNTPDPGLSVFDPDRYGFLAPVSYRNLSVFLITGPDQLGKIPMLTLQEALARKKALVRETGEVGKLLITNKSAGKYIFVQAGDIVRGGKQDRTLQHDLIIPPRAKNVPLQSFCVEQGRWRQRADEPMGAFGSAGNALASNRMKVALRVHGSQSLVWENVDAFQQDLSDSLNKPVQSELSESSLELTLEDEDLKQALQPYLNILQPLGSLRKDILGVAFALNGRVTSVDLYASPGLFQKFWPKLLKAAASEALTETEKDAQHTIPAAAAVKQLLTGLDQVPGRHQHLNDITVQVTRKGSNYALFETHLCPQHVLVHLNWLYVEKGTLPQIKDLLIEPGQFRR